MSTATNIAYACRMARHIAETQTLLAMGKRPIRVMCPQTYKRACESQILPIRNTLIDSRDHDGAAYLDCLAEHTTELRGRTRAQLVELTIELGGIVVANARKKDLLAALASAFASAQWPYMLVPDF
jgi:hypothetical protein